MIASMSGDLMGRMRTTVERLRTRVRDGWGWVRSHGKRPECPAALFAVLSAAAVIGLNNHKLFSFVSEHVGLRSLSGLGCFISIYLLLTGMVTLAFLVLGFPYVLKPLAIVTLLLSAVLSHFTGEMGVMFDVGMIRNIAENFRDGNVREARELFSVPLAVHVLLFGVLPSGLALIPRISYGTIGRELRTRSLYAAGFTALLALFLLGNFRRLTYLTHENFVVRCYATPTYALNCLRKYATSSWREGRAPFLEIGTDAVRRKSGRARTVGVLVVGETARADHFSLNGYERKTNPRLERRPLLNYPNTRAAGTSTAYSVPYLFSFLGKNKFSTDRAANQSNLLDVLTRAGVKVVWVDNNSGSKRVSDRVTHVDLRAAPDPASPYYDDGGYRDEVLVGELERQIASTDQDLLIVLHTMGSHGPAYYRRYPPAFEVFKPCCKQSSPQRSPQDEVVNAYDNSILYTDFVLDLLIARLEARQGTEESFLFYVSDHGESLGENGVYLHGLPEVLAPSAQTHVPMLAWLSPGILAGRSLDYARLQERTRTPCSHDNVASTMLGMFEVQTSLYREDLDLLRPK
jgi:lipid A ethanolaminephosphotransferase